MVSPGGDDRSEKKEGGMAKVGGWLAGILAVIIGGYGVWYFTQPPAVTTIEGMVYSGSAPVPKAMVAVDLSGSAGTNGAVHDITDENGSYRIDFTGLPKGAGAILTVTATGYQTVPSKSLTSPLEPATHIDFPLLPVPPPPGVPPPPPPPHPILPRIPVFVPKQAAQATKYKVLRK
jgi:hypothetical protein